MTLQTFFQIVLFIGIILSAFGGSGPNYSINALYVGISFSAIGGLGSYLCGKFEADKTQQELKAEIKELRADTSKTRKLLELIFEGPNVKKETWMEVEMKNVPQGVTDQLLLLFKSDKGIISGKVRIKGSKDIYLFSTIPNDHIPLAVRNLWLPNEGKYKEPTIMEFAVTEKTEPDASLKIFTAGYIQDLGKPFGKPH